MSRRPAELATDSRLLADLAEIRDHINHLDYLADVLAIALDDATSFDPVEAVWAFDPGEEERLIWHQVLDLLIDLQSSMVAFDSVPDFTRIRRRAYWELNRLRQR